MNLKLNIELNKKQQYVFDEIFTNDKYTEISLYGSSRAGKSFLIAYYFFLRAIIYPKSYQIFIRKTFNALKQGMVLQTFPNLFEVINKINNISIYHEKINGNPIIQYNGTDNLFRFFNGSEIRFAGLDTESTNRLATDKILSTEYITIDIEEGSEIKFEVIEKLKTRLSQQVCDMLGRYAVPKMITSLNPTTFDSWDYLYFIAGENPRSKEKYDDDVMSKRVAIHFSVLDNKDFIHPDFIEQLKQLSPMNRQRFLIGEYGDIFEGEIFKEIAWEQLPPIDEFESILIYNDPSYKSGVKNDYKATGVIGKRKGAFWLINCIAEQCTTMQMIINNHLLYQDLRERGWHKPIICWFENAGLSDDFQSTVQSYAEQVGWVCPFKLDTRQKGDKFVRIESALVPLNEQGKLFFNKDLKLLKIGNLIQTQMCNFKRSMASDEHDDIPDMLHGGVTLLNIAQPKAGSSIVNRGEKITY